MDGKRCRIRGVLLACGLLLVGWAGSREEARRTTRPELLAAASRAEAAAAAAAAAAARAVAPRLVGGRAREMRAKKGIREDHRRPLRGRSIIGRSGVRDAAGLSRLELELAGASSKASMAERLGSKVKNERSEVAMQMEQKMEEEESEEPGCDCVGGSRRGGTAYQRARSKVATKLGGAIGQGLAEEGCSCKRDVLRSVISVLQGRVDGMSRRRGSHGSHALIPKQ